MTYKVIIDRIEKEQWEQYAKGFADYSIYQTWPYQQVRAEMARQRVSRFIINDNTDQVVTMGQVRIKYFRPLGLKIGYIQWGPLVRNKNGTLKCSAETLNLLRQAYLGPRVNGLRLVPNVFDNETGQQMAQMLRSSGFTHVPQVKPYHTIILSLEASEEELRRSLRRQWRQHLRKAENAGLEIKESSNLEYFSIFEVLYQLTKKRKNFQGLDLQEFLRTQQGLNEPEKMKLIVVYCDGQPVNAHISAHMGDTAIALLAAGNNLGMQRSASNLAWWRALLSAKRAGMKYFDLGGIDLVDNASVYRFKKGLSGIETFHIGAFEACSSTRVQVIWRLAEKVYNLVKR